MSANDPADLTAETEPGPQDQVSYAVLDQALWNQFANAGSPEEFAQSWLALLCRDIRGVTAGVVVLGEPDIGPFAPAAFWPEEEAVGSNVTAVAEQAITKRQPVLSGQAGIRDVALPIFVDGHLYGVCAVSVGADGLHPNEVIRHLRWGSGWIEVLMRRDQERSYERLRERTAVALDMLASVLEQKRFRAACTALVTELAMKLKCDPVSIGFLRRRQIHVAAISHAAGFGTRMNLIRDICAAMSEAVDQEAVVHYPANPNWDYRVMLMHEELARAHKADAVLTVPVQHDGEIVGALTFERVGDDGFDDATVELCDAIATIVGPVLEEKRRNDRLVIVKLFEAIWSQLVRLLGPNYFGRKLATLIFMGVAAYFMTATGDFEITAPAELEGVIQRTLVAPFNGYLSEENVRAGAIVVRGELLAKLDDQDMMLERLRLTTSRRQRIAEYDQALANRERAQANIIESQIKQIESQIALIKIQLARTRITAPFDGIVVSGDLSQLIGTTVERGQELFKIAPLNAYRVVLEVNETDIAEIEVGQTGQLRVTSLPDEPLGYTIERVTPIAVQKDGRNFFRVQARLDTANPRLRPSMKGIARTHIDARLVFAIWTRPIANWAKLALWRWRP